MRSRTLLIVALVSFMLPVVASAAIPFFGPIIPQPNVSGVTGSDVCAGGWAMVMVVINNIISLLITLAIVFVAPLMIAYSGFLFVVNPVNSSGKEQAKKILTNTIVGIVIALAGWLIVDAVMAVLYNPGASSGTTALTTWSNLITTTGADYCIPLRSSLNQTAPGTNATGITAGTGSLGSPPSGRAGTACDPAAVQAGAAAGGYTLTAAQANTLACIAAPESSCGRTLINYNYNNGSSAVGAFQVLLQRNSQCYENPACISAAGVLRGPLNCASGFRGGNPIPGSAVAQQCVQAASNLNCSASAAACLLANNGGSFSPWQADVNSARQTGCITSGT